MTKNELLQFAVRSAEQIDSEIHRNMLAGQGAQDATIDKLIMMTQLNAQLIGALIEKLPDEEEPAPKIELAS